MTFIIYLSKEFNANVIDLLKKTDLSPYNYWDSFEKFKEGLPSKDKFCNTLANHAVSYKNYEHVLNIWKTLVMSNIKDRHDLYLEVLLMICAFETYGKECINYFELNPTLFLSTSGLQRFGDVDLKLISYIEVSIL